MASRKAEEMKQRLLQEREKLLRQRDAIDNEIKGIERAIALISAEENVPSSGGKRTQIKGIVLELLEDVGTTGLNATDAVQMANRKGLTIERASVSSLLSRLKKDGVVIYDGEKYRLPKFAKTGNQPSQTSFHVLPGMKAPSGSG